MMRTRARDPRLFARHGPWRSGRHTRQPGGPAWPAGGHRGSGPADLVRILDPAEPLGPGLPGRSASAATTAALALTPVLLALTPCLVAARLGKLTARMMRSTAAGRENNSRQLAPCAGAMGSSTRIKRPESSSRGCARQKPQAGSAPGHDSPAGGDPPPPGEPREMSQGSDTGNQAARRYNGRAAAGGGVQGRTRDEQ